jgi:hypothetical protein
MLRNDTMRKTWKFWALCLAATSIVAVDNRVKRQLMLHVVKLLVQVVVGDVDRCNRKSFGRYEGTKQTISSFLKSFNVRSGVEPAAESETTNVPRTNRDAVRLMRLRLIMLPSLIDSITLSITIFFLELKCP